MRKMLPALLILMVSGCLGDGSVGVNEHQEPAPMPSGHIAGFKVFVQVGPFLNGEQTIAVRLEGREEELGSYQGKLLFDVRKMELLESMEPQDGYRVTNLEGASRGEVRFAGFTVDGFLDRELLRIHFSTRDPIQASALAVEFSVVGTLEGAAVPQSRIAREPGLFRLE